MSPRRKNPRLHPDVYCNPGAMASVTICVQDRLPILTEDPAPGLLLDLILDLHGSAYRILGFCIMPDHIHLLVFNHAGSIPDMVRLFKGRAAAALRRCGRRAVWQKSYYDHLVRRNEDIPSVLRYLLENPIRMGLVEDWMDYPWCGSCEWSEIDASFFEKDAGNIVWSEAVSPSE